MTAKQKQTGSTVSEHGSVVRVFHPNADTWMDVDADKTGQWLDSGWTESAGSHNRVNTYPALRDTDAKLAEVELATQGEAVALAAAAEAESAARANGLDVQL